MDEVIAYCKLIAAEPFLTVNMSTGTVRELNASSIQDVNTLEEPEKEAVEHSVRSLSHGATNYLAPAHSIRVLEVGLAR